MYLLKASAFTFYILVLCTDELFGHYRFLRSIYSYEFVFYDKMEQMVCGFHYSILIFYLLTYLKKSLYLIYTLYFVVLQEFEETLKKLEYLNVIEMSNDYFSLANNKKFQVLLLNLLSPFISSYCCVCRILQKVIYVLINVYVLYYTRMSCNHIRVI